MPLIVNDDALTEEYLRANRFTDDAAYVVRDSVQRAFSRALAGLVPQAMVLWSILNWERKLALAALDYCGVDEDALRQAILNELAELKVDTYDEDIDFRHISDTSVSAGNISRTRGEDYVGTEHLLLALCRSSDAIVQRVFEKFGITYQRIEVALRELL